MWVDKDDVFADDKVPAFKESNTEARTHLRATQSAIMPHPTLASSRSSSTSYYTPHILSMSSDGCSDLPSSTHQESFSPPAGPQSGSPSDVKITEAIQLLWIGTLPINSVEFAETASILAHPRPLTPFTRNANGHRMASGAAPCSPAVDGRMEPGEVHCWDDSHHPDYEPDDRHCARCDGPMEYCHGHDTPDPILIPALVTPVFI